jgi:hypothetical protein
MQALELFLAIRQTDLEFADLRLIGQELLRSSSFHRGADPALKGQEIFDEQIGQLAGGRSVGRTVLPTLFRDQYFGWHVWTLHDYFESKSGIDVCGCRAQRSRMNGIDDRPGMFEFNT